MSICSLSTFNCDIKTPFLLIQVGKGTKKEPCSKDTGSESIETLLEHKRKLFPETDGGN